MVDTLCEPPFGTGRQICRWQPPPVAGHQWRAHTLFAGNVACCNAANQWVYAPRTPTDIAGCTPADSSHFATTPVQWHFAKWSDSPVVAVSPDVAPQSNHPIGEASREPRSLEERSKRPSPSGEVLYSSTCQDQKIGHAILAVVATGFPQVHLQVEG